MCQSVSQPCDDTRVRYFTGNNASVSRRKILNGNSGQRTPKMQETDTHYTTPEQTPVQTATTTFAHLRPVSALLRAVIAAGHPFYLFFPGCPAFCQQVRPAAASRTPVRNSPVQFRLQSCRMRPSPAVVSFSCSMPCGHLLTGTVPAVSDVGQMDRSRQGGRQEDRLNRAPERLCHIHSGMGLCCWARCRS